MKVFVFGDTQLGPAHRAAVRAHLRRLSLLCRIVHGGKPGAGALANSEAMGEYVTVDSQVVRQGREESLGRYVGRLLRKARVSYWLLFHQQQDFARGNAAELLAELRRRKVEGRIVLLSMDGRTLETQDFEPTSE